VQIRAIYQQVVSQLHTAHAQLTPGTNSCYHHLGKTTIIIQKNEPLKM